VRSHDFPPDFPSGGQTHICPRGAIECVLSQKRHILRSAWGVYKVGASGAERTSLSFSLSSPRPPSHRSPLAPARIPLFLGFFGNIAPAIPHCPPIMTSTGDKGAGDSDLYRPDVDISTVDERKLMRRIDYRVIPWLALLYLLNLYVPFRMHYISHLTTSALQSGQRKHRQCQTVRARERPPHHRHSILARVNRLFLPVCPLGGGG
jgi:hypothetical protein